MQSEQLINLLTEAKALTDRQKEQARLSGENFNIFKILELESSEVRLHSRFIAELLDTRGTHNQGSTFLQLFLDLFQFRDSGFDGTGAYAKVEFPIGNISDDGMRGGRIDIIVTDLKHRHLIIENKIYAKDQDKQLLRYHNHSPNSSIFYLTLSGGSPDESSCAGLVKDEHYRCLSYDEDIVSWLEACLKNIPHNPLLRASITQYINLIKHLNNHPTNKAMAEELSSLIIANLEAAYFIKSNVNAANKVLIEKLNSMVKELAQEFEKDGLDYYYYLDISKQYSGFRFFKEEWKYYSIAFQLGDYGQYYRYGLATIEDPKDVKVPPAVLSAIQAKTGEATGESWWAVKRKPVPPFGKNWDVAYEGWEAIANGTFKEVIRQELTEMLTLVDGLMI